MPHTNGKNGGQHSWKGGKRKRKFDGEHDAGIQKILKEKRLQKKRKQDLKEQEETMLLELQTKYKEMEKKSSRTFLRFTDFPLSWRTQEGLKENEYTKPTEIQRDTIAHSLSGADVVGAAKTGSGKTLALVIPILEALWRARWSPEYGLGALVISPTRELALQTFSTINAVGKHHGFSCGLVIGGSEVSYEKNRISGINIIVCTPGRLLQHMDENEQMNCDSLQILVLDEADRMLDMGFAKQLNSIVNNLPSERQTLLFSATQTRNVKDLCRVCTNDPVFVSVHENASAATPDNLKQSYVIVEEESKINTLWSFIEAHKKKKSLVFVSSCKQARFLTEVFSQLRPGLPVMGLWGTMNQKKRIETFTKFDEAKAAVLIATDVASRGLDFEHIDWVIQMDCPAQIDDYIHRVGRSARMDDSGNSLLMVTSSQESPMIAKLEKHNIPIEELKIHPDAVTDVRQKLRAMLAESPELKEWAQKSIVAYLRAVHTMRDKRVFDVNSINVAAFSDSFGLVSVPRLRFLKAQKTKEAPEVVEDSEDPKTTESLIGQFAIDEDDDEIFTMKEKKTGENPEIPEEKAEIPAENAEKITLKKGKPLKKALTKVGAAKKILNKKLRVNTKKTFDEEEEGTVEGPSTITSYGLDIEKARQELKSGDKADRKRFKELREQRRQEKLAKKNKKKEEEEEEYDMESDDDEPDISWLPDPDAVRRKYGQTEEESDDGDEWAEPMDTEDLEKQALAMLGKRRK
ncbi:hypothetical protein GCK72_003111 [Caenorhabditis remanei]|uniref:ATP-dependent RNA helicase n=1 Tax=Caenorhabditis remanei TaxID=31234 RepID=A0A6A5HUJ6_CAERE|nr:hypothetical protein GCK72_003111 [Caenorhabditis remanei]KAF1771285.1 hypothetical protein GCK72_003111 [Caenorhabditis remanei]